MSNIISPDFLKAGTHGTAVTGVVLIKDYKITLTKQGKEYIAGNIASGIQVPFKAWGSSVAFTKMKAEDYINVPCLIQGTFDDYQGSMSIIIDSVTAVADYKPEDFLPIKYNIDGYYTGLVSFCQKVLSSEGYALLDKILFSNSDIVERFKLEFAAKSHHDNCKGGLLVHTYKVLNSIYSILNMYKGLHDDNQKIKDLYYLGTVLHDIGKIWEMNFGNYQTCAVVTHRYLGLEYISKFKDEIVAIYGEDWYYNLASIFLQHHGEYDDDCRSIYAQVIHFADCLDADLTSIVEAKELAVNPSIRFRDKYLSFMQESDSNEA